MRMYSRSEFPVTKIGPIVDAKGRINRRSIKMRFGAIGCPNGSVEFVVGAIKAGTEPCLAMQLAMLAYYAKDLSIEPVERVSRAILTNAKAAHRAAHPNGLYAEEYAAMREGRASRWGTPEFHRDPAPTEHYPFRA